MLENLIPLLLPLWWSAARQRASAWGGVLALYLLGAHEQPAAILQVLPEFSSLGSRAIWGLHALLLSLPWAWLWQAPTQSPAKRGFSSGAVLLLSLLPPWGLIGWLHPLTLSGVLYPAWGLGGLLATSLLWSAWNAHQRALIQLLLLAALLANAGYRAPALPLGWQAVNTHLNTPGNLPGQRLERQTQLIQLVQSRWDLPSPQPHRARVLLLPESIAGVWTGAEAYWWSALCTHITHSQDILILGALTQDASGQAQNAAQLIGAPEVRWVWARQPIPLADWSPWRPGGLASNWVWHDALGWHLNRGQEQIAGRQVQFSFCFEELLVFPQLVSALGTGAPQVLISLSNHGWAQDLREPAVQAVHARWWARLWGIPLLRADNVPQAGS